MSVSKQAGTVGQVSDEFLMDSMYKFLHLLMKRGSKEKYKKPVLAENLGRMDVLGDKTGGGETAGEGRNSFTLIEDLELGPRSYNCLRRAGVDSVEKLRTMNREKLLHVRNLSLRCVEEIMQSLEDFPEMGPAVHFEGACHADMLEELIGLENVKKQISRIAAFSRMKKSMKSEGKSRLPVVLNMEFTGNPGTAKTTVARITAVILRETGLLTSGEVVEVGCEDLEAKYEGQTADMVRNAFGRATGKGLFIDETYSLLEGWDGGCGGFGDEAIDTIV